MKDYKHVKKINKYEYCRLYELRDSCEFRECNNYQIVREKKYISIGTKDDDNKWRTTWCVYIVLIRYYINIYYTVKFGIYCSEN